MNKNLIQKAEKFVENECKKPTSKYGQGVLVEHFIPMIKHSKNLCRRLGGDMEVVLLAAWLHDIGSIVYGRIDHHITSVKVAKKFLAENNYDKEKTKLVLKCIKHHRQSTNYKRETLEEKIIADADAICNFDMIQGSFYATLVTEKLSPIDAAKSVKKKLENKWQKLHFPESKKIIKPKYQAAMLLLDYPSKL